MQWNLERRFWVAIGWVGSWRVRFRHAAQLWVRLSFLVQTLWIPDGERASQGCFSETGAIRRTIFHLCIVIRVHVYRLKLENLGGVRV